MLGQSGGGKSYSNMGEITMQRRNLLKVPVIGAFTLYILNYFEPHINKSLAIHV